MQTTLAQFNETQSQDAFALQNSKLLKVSLNQVTIQAKLGVDGRLPGRGRLRARRVGRDEPLLKKAVTGEGQSLMKVTGQGEVFLADRPRTST